MWHSRIDRLVSNCTIAPTQLTVIEALVSIYRPYDHYWLGPSSAKVVDSLLLPSMTFHKFIEGTHWNYVTMPRSWSGLVLLVKSELLRLNGDAVASLNENYISQKYGCIWLLRDLVIAYALYSAVLYPVFRPLIVYGPMNVCADLYSCAVKWAFSIVMTLPPIKKKVESELEKTVTAVEAGIIKNDESLLQFPALPEHGVDSEKVLHELNSTSSTLVHSDWEAGKVSGAVYHGGESLLDLQLQAYQMYSVANQLHPDVFPGIRKMEAEVVAMVLDLFHGPLLACGSTTSGGTESLLLAGLAARVYGRRRKGITMPEVIAPITVHAGIEKACYYFNMRLHKVEVDPVTYKVNVNKMRRLINGNTVLLVGSAPNYPHGIIDDIEEISKLAVKHDIPLHVDACLGSFIVTFLEKSKVHGDKKIPLFDFRVPGVTSISCDTHKYGFAPKGSSIIMYRNPEIRQCQYYVQSDWTGGMYGSPTLAGSRPGALMAGCWATLLNIGASGYEKSCYDIVTVMNTVKRAIQTQDPLKTNLAVIGDPLASVVSFKVRESSKLNIYQIGDAMTKKGWHLASLQNPPALHFAFTRLSVSSVDVLIADLIDTVEEQLKAESVPESDTAALYGVAGSVSTAGIADRVIVAFLDALYKL